ncbi:hypothetical protein V6M85_13565 [Sulfolobus tengchongensis]|uniref:Uncharacterized protein n=1 Tax=Sulfolobus tengchongensis TaxID=207809 RepID=A0AAX4L0I3_9CREN
MNTKYLLTIPLLTLFLITAIITNAVSASQIGANQIVGSYKGSNWAGIVYSDYWSGILSGSYNPIISVFETIYLENLTIHYMQNPLNAPNNVGIWVALSPCPVTQTGSSNISNTLLQAGYGIIVYENNSVEIQWFVQGFNKNNFIINYSGFIPTGNFAELYVSLENLENGTALAQFYAFYNVNNQIVLGWQHAQYVSWPFSNQNAQFAYTILESPRRIALNAYGFPVLFYTEIPVLNGGLIKIGFIYQVTYYTISGPRYYQYIGPGSGSQSGTDIQADLFTLPI